MNKLRVGDTVMHKGKKTKVLTIEVNCSKEEPLQWIFVSAVAWSAVLHGDRQIIVTLDNGHWAYDYQITPEEVSSEN